MEVNVIDNQSASRYEMQMENQLVFADYARQGNEVRLLHVETPPALRGRGAAGELMKGIVEIAKAENLHLVPICPYAVTWMKRNKIG